MSGGTDKEQLLFTAALPMADAGERAAFLKAACAEDEGLRSRVTLMLADHDHSEDFFSGCLANLALDEAEAAELPAEENDSPVAGEMAGMRVGRYRLLRQLGEGGCGVVYLAEQEEPVRRRVAFKVIKLGMDTKNVIARFDVERQALAMMEHPNIARVLDGGATESGRPYFVLELVQGVKITTYCDEERLTVRQRLELFIKVGLAIQHAHQKGVIHRDIKPSNILVTMQDGAPVPKVIDFGIAKAIEERLVANTDFTPAGQIIGTPAYMSPEQAELSGLDVDTRSDIYSLGVLLYELLTGLTPFDQKELIQSGVDEMRRTLREQEPRRPSAILAGLRATELAGRAALCRLEPARLIKLLKGDLDWIVIKALEKDRQRRYETVNAMVMDVRRHLHNEPVNARPPSKIYRLQKLIQRNKVVYASGLLVALSLITGLGVATSFFFKERESRASEMLLRKEAEAREKITEAGVLLSHGATKEADNLMDAIPVKLLYPSQESSDVFRKLGLWNLFQRNWKQAANRYIVLLQVNQVDKNDRTGQTMDDLLLAAPLLIEAGALTDYDRIRRAALAKLGGTTSPNSAEQLIKTSLLLPADEAIMKQLEPLGETVAEALKARNPAPVLAAWWTFALSLLEYRQGNFNAAETNLLACAKYSKQSPACVASTHLLLSMTLRQLGRIEESEDELAQGRTMVQDRFQRTLESGDDKIGKIQGWIATPILLHEAEALASVRADAME